jgi:hypothetical protein
VGCRARVPGRRRPGYVQLSSSVSRRGSYRSWPRA